MSLPTKRRLPTWTLPFAAVAAILLGILLWTLTRKQEPTAIHAVRPDREDLIQTVSTTGTVKPMNEFQARANFPGIIDKLYVALGDKVEPGQMLVEMKDPYAVSRVAAANSNLKSAQLGDQNTRQGGSAEDRIALAGDLEHAHLAQSKAQNALATLKQLQARGAASEAEVAGAEQQLEAANTTLKTLTARTTGRYNAADKAATAARLADARAQLDAAQEAYANAHISSPIAGTVYSIPVSLYDFVPMGADLLNVANLKQVQIHAFFDEPEMGGLAVGQPVRILWDGKPNREWHGHVKQAPVAAMVMGPRSVGEVTINADDANGELLPNITVTVIVATEHASHALSIPREALHNQGGKHFVFRVVDGKLMRTPVEIGIVNLSRAEIRSGITEADTIAVSGITRYELTDGLPVRVVP